MRAQILLLSALATLAGCSKAISDKDAEALVRRYNDLIIDAYRSGDYRVAEPVVGEDELRRLVGHIGARSDQGLTLDSRLLEFRVDGVKPEGDGVVVSTEERWSYFTRRTGTGAQAGPESKDHYLLRYHLKKVEKRWVVSEVEFAKPPEVGNPVPPPELDVRTMHGLPSKEEGTGIPGQPSGEAPMAAPGPDAPPPGHPAGGMPGGTPPPGHPPLGAPGAPSRPPGGAP